MAATALRELGHEVAIVPLSTQGDRDARRTFAEIGGRGIFASEIEEALCDGRIDVAVHSAKDLTGDDVDGPVPRPPAWSAPTRATRGSGRHGRGTRCREGARVATASLRRSLAAPAHSGPTCRSSPSAATSRRACGSAPKTASTPSSWRPRASTASVSPTEIGFRIPPGEMPPESGQGIVVLQVRAGEESLVAGADHADSSLALHAERAVTRALAGGCTVPVAAHAARLGDGRWRLYAYADRDGVISLEQADGADPLALAAEVLAAIG